MSQYLPKIEDEAVKTLIKKGIVKAAAETDEAKREQILNTIYSYARLVEQGDGGVSSATTIITVVQSKLNGFTSSRGKYEWGWGLGDSDVEVIEKTMQNGLNSENIGYFVTNFSFGGKPIHEAIYDECHDDYNVCKNTYTSIYYAIEARFNELGITNDNNPTAYQALVAAKAQIWAIEWSSDPICGANDTECEKACDELGKLINEFKKIENAHAGESKTDKELELMNLIK